MLRTLIPFPLVVTSVLAQTVEVDLTAALGVHQIEPGLGIYAWMYNGTMPGPVIRVTEGQTLRVRFHNDLTESTTTHFHGQPVRVGMDGVPGISRPATAPGQEFDYVFEDLLPGTYWYHPHGGEGQLDRGLAGVLIVDPANPSDDPAYDVEQVIVLDDWFDPFSTSVFIGHLLNGATSGGQTPIVVQSGQRLRLRILNAAAWTNYVIALDGHPMTVTHADGNRVQPVVVQALPIGMGERYDVIVDCTNPGVWSLAASSINSRGSTVVRGIVQYAGQVQAPPADNFVPTNLSSGQLLDYSQLAAYFPVAPITPTPDRVFSAVLGMSMGPNGPLRTINAEAWPVVTPFQVALGDEVEMTISNSMSSPFDYHPMHIHGHFFRLMNTAGGVTHPPLKDTVMVAGSGQPNGSVQVQISMDNPGRWLFHCHHMDHMARGMMGLVDYAGDSDGDGIPDVDDMEASLDVPVVTIDSQATSFAPGATGSVQVQWTPGETFACALGFSELPASVALPPLGTFRLGTPSAHLGTVVMSAAGTAAIPYSIPNVPTLSGLRVGLQGIGTTSLAGGFRFSTYQPMWVR
ncbi:MAG: multicopper oxidase family protein [Planctomycetes bacterium]|nr:multicopper oxidase family protein [Planctomycetota bacterium]